MCYKYVNAVNRYAAEGNKKTKTSPILKGVKAVFTREIHLSRETVQDFVSEASKCDFDVDLGYNRIVVDAKSIMGVFSLDLTRSLTVRYPLKDDQFEVAYNRLPHTEEIPCAAFFCRNIGLSMNCNIKVEICEKICVKKHHIWSMM